MNLINVVAPVYNEEGTINEFILQVCESLNKITNDYKILLVDDGSKDNSWSVISKICKENNNVVGIKLSKNFGHHYAITAGIHKSDSQWVIVMDSDLQDRPEVIPELYQEATKGFDVVFVRRIERPESLLYRMFQKLFYFLLKVLSGINFDSTQANFSIISKKVVDAFIKFPEQARFYGSTINWLGFSKSTINAKHGSRFHGKPSYTLKKRVNLAADIILSFSDRPLKFSIYLGILISFFSFTLIGWILYRLFIGGFSVTGWASLLSATLLIGGVQIFILGILGIYLSRIFAEVKSRPLFIIEKIID